MSPATRVPDSAGCAAVTVVVPTRNRPTALQRCLTALSRQTQRLELIVVDDGSRPGAREENEGLARSAGGHFVAASGRGPGAARNAGVAAATADLVAFCDDDCEPEPDWSALLAATCPPDGAVAGETVSGEGGALPRASQLLTSELQRVSWDETAGSLGFAPTCNLAVRATVLERFPFNESFQLAAGEDREWCARIRAAGVTLAFEPRAVAHHRPGLDLAAFLRQQRRYGRGAAALRRAGLSLSDAGTRGALARAALRAGPAVAGAVALAQLAVASGALAETLRPTHSPSAVRREDPL